MAPGTLAAAVHTPGPAAAEGAAPTTTLYLVRHGETAWNRMGRLQGSRDLALNEVGQRQVAALAERFQSLDIAAAYSSPLRRARETAGAILAGRDVPLRIVADLAEMRCGAWEGLDAAERERSYPDVVKAWREDPWRAGIPDAEPLEAVRLRVGRALGAILRESIGRSVLVSGHGFLNRVALLSLLGRPREAFWELKQPNASCHVLCWEGTIPHRDPLSADSPPPRMRETLVGEGAAA